MKSSTPILLVEDDKVDRMRVKRALRDLRITNPLRTASDGVEALEFLMDPHNDRPCLILLDINMPRMGGIEFLRKAKALEGIRLIPVIVLTGSTADKDRIESFNLGVAGYMIKPPDYRQLVEVIRTIDLYWTINELPGGGKRDGI